jgi:hypothetical protein
MEGVGVFEYNPTDLSSFNTTSSRRLDAIAVISERGILRTSEPDTDVRTEAES